MPGTASHEHQQIAIQRVDQSQFLLKKINFLLFIYKKPKEKKEYESILHVKEVINDFFDRRH